MLKMLENELLDIIFLSLKTLEMSDYDKKFV